MEPIEQFTNEQVINFPKVENVEFIPISPSYLKVLLLTTGLTAIVVYASFIYMVSQSSKLDDVFWYVLLVLSLVFFFIGLSSVLGFKKRMYAIREHDINYRRGFFVHKQTSVPYKSIQHLSLKQGVISRMFKLASLHVYTAGDSSSDLVIHGLPEEKASEIREYILGTIKSDG